MRVMVTARFKGSENKADIEALCTAVRAAGLKDVSFIRDIEHYQKTFNSPKELWARTKLEIERCDALLINISDNPSGGRVIEAGIAFALGKPVLVVVKKGMSYKEIYDGIATIVIPYEDYEDITSSLKFYAPAA